MGLGLSCLRPNLTALDPDARQIAGVKDVVCPGTAFNPDVDQVEVPNSVVHARAALDPSAGPIRRATTGVVKAATVEPAFAEIDVKPAFPERPVVEIGMIAEKVRDGPIAGFPRQALSVPTNFRIGMKE
jgi:hypothetical protein